MAQQHQHLGLGCSWLESTTMRAWADLRVVLQCAKRQEVDVEPNWCPPVGRVMLGIVVVVDAAVPAERPQAILCPELSRVCHPFQQTSKLTAVSRQHPHKHGEKPHIPA